MIGRAIERTQFLAERDAAKLVQQKADLAATLLDRSVTTFEPR
jgi:hypothetical protein